MARQRNARSADPKPGGTVELTEAQLDGISGGPIQLLQPAIQKVRDADTR